MFCFFSHDESRMCQTHRPSAASSLIGVTLKRSIFRYRGACTDRGTFMLMKQEGSGRAARRIERMPRPEKIASSSTLAGRYPRVQRKTYYSALKHIHDTTIIGVPSESFGQCRYKGRHETIRVLKQGDFFNSRSTLNPHHSRSQWQQQWQTMAGPQCPEAETHGNHSRSSMEHLAPREISRSTTSNANSKPKRNNGRRPSAGSSSSESCIGQSRMMTGSQ